MTDKLMSGPLRLPGTPLQDFDLKFAPRPGTAKHVWLQSLQHELTALYNNLEKRERAADEAVAKGHYVG